MSDDEEEAGPAVPLGEGPDVEGAPVARVASRLHYPIEKSTVVRREGETTVRTQDGPRTMQDVLEASDVVYFDTRQAFTTAVHDVVGHGPVPTVGDEESSAVEPGADASESEADATESEADATESEADASEADASESGADATESEADATESDNADETADTESEDADSDESTDADSTDES